MVFRYITWYYMVNHDMTLFQNTIVFYYAPCHGFPVSKHHPWYIMVFYHDLPWFTMIYHGSWLTCFKTPWYTMAFPMVYFHKSKNYAIHGHGPCMCETSYINEVTLVCDGNLCKGPSNGNPTQHTLHARESFNQNNFDQHYKLCTPKLLHILDTNHRKIPVLPQDWTDWSIKS